MTIKKRQTMKLWSFPITLVIGLFLLVSCLPSAPPLEQHPIEPNWLYLTQIGGDIQKILRMDLNSDLTEPKTMIAIPVSHPESLLLSSDGRFLSVRSDSQVTIYDISNGAIWDTITKMPRPTSEFATPRLDNAVVWSPDSRFLSFLVDDPATYFDIMVYDVMNKKVQNLTNNVYRENAVSWSSDSERMVFATDNCGQFINDCPPDQLYWNIAITNVSTQEQKIISAGTVEYQLEGNWIDNSLCATQLSPDQSYVVYEIYCPADGIPSYKDIFLSATAGTEPVRLTNFADIDYANYYSSLWSQDGQYLFVAYDHDYIFSDEMDSSGILAFDITSLSKPIANVTIKDLEVDSINWSEDGTFFVGRVGDQNLAGQINNAEIVILTTNLPKFTLEGCWVEDSYISELDGELIKISLPALEIVNLDFKVESYEFLGCSKG